MANILQYVADMASRRRRAPRVNRISFGNGYSQKYGDGLNANQESWDVQFTAHSDADKEYLDNFFNDNFLTYFFWQSSELSASIKPYECMSWEIGFLGAGNYSISAVFDEYVGIYEIADPDGASLWTDENELIDSTPL